MKKSYEIVEGNKMNMIKKSLAVGVILLFFGVAVAPSINFSVVKAVSDNELIEVTSEACGIKGFGNTTVKLTKQQYQDLQNYLVKFRDKLNTTTTREEAVPIFNEAVVELDKYELLPKGMNVDQAQKLVTGPYQNKNILKLQEKLLNNHLIALDNNSNYFCLITGNVSSVNFFSAVIMPFVLDIKLIEFFSKYNLSLLTHLTGSIGLLLSFIFMGYILTHDDLLNAGFLNRLNLFSYVSFGYTTGNHPIHNNPSEGWVFSFGLSGFKTWNGSFWGNYSWVGCGTMGVSNIYYLGAIGFAGISIYNKQNLNSFFFGTTLHINLCPDFPSPYTD